MLPQRNKIFACIISVSISPPVEAEEVKCTRSYVVQPRENLSQILHKFGVESALGLQLDLRRGFIFDRIAASFESNQGESQKFRKFSADFERKISVFQFPIYGYLRADFLEFMSRDNILLSRERQREV